MTRTDRTARQRPRPAGDSDAQLRGLVGAGPTRLPAVSAMRARDVDRPTDADLADAERTLVLRRGQRLPLPAAAERAAGAAGEPPVTPPGPRADRPRRGADGRAARAAAPGPVPAPQHAAGTRRPAQDAVEAAPGAAGTSPVRS